MKRLLLFLLLLVLPLTARAAGFTVSNGNIIDPNGAVWIARGLNVCDDTMANFPGANLQSLFPKINFIRLDVGCDNNGFGAAQPNAAIESWVASVTAQRIVVEIQSHFTGQPAANTVNLTNEASWYSALAADLKSNPYVWFGSGNELNTPGLTAEHLNVYNAVRGQGNNSIVMLVTADGNPMPNGGTPDGPASSYNSLTNIVWDQHFYNWATGGSTSLSAVTTTLTTDINAAKSYTTSANTGGTIPVLLSEIGYEDVQCNGGTTNSGGCGSLQSMEVAMSPAAATVNVSGQGSTTTSANGSVGFSVYLAYFPPCCHQDDQVTNFNALTVAQPPLIVVNTGVITSQYIALGPGPPSGGTESANGTTITTAGPTINASPTPGSAGSGNLIAITAGAQITVNGNLLGVSNNVIKLYYINHTAYQENASLNWFGPITATDAGAQVANPVVSTSTSNLQPDLSAAAAHPVTGFPAGKIAYSGHVFPNNVAGAAPDTPLATATAIWNTYFGYLAKTGTAVVANLGTGCACDGSNGNLTDDQTFAGNWVTYANGLAAGGPAFTGAQQPIGNAWYSWGNFGENPNGTLNSDGTLKGASAGQAGGQAFYWSQLLYSATLPPPVPTTTWNGLDASAGITLSGNNQIATTTASTPQSVRATTSRSTGKQCFSVAASGTITADWNVGLSSSTYVLTAPAGLGGDTTGIGFDPNSPGNLQGVFFGNVRLSSGSATSANGETAMICADLDAHLFWATDSAMRTAVGSGTWNNSAACDPTVASCGLSFSGLTGPYFPIYNNFQTGSAATLGTTAASLPFALPTGFSAWDLPVTTGKPIIMIFGDNDNQPMERTAS